MPDICQDMSDLNSDRSWGGHIVLGWDFVNHLLVFSLIAIAGVSSGKNIWDSVFESLTNYGFITTSPCFELISIVTLLFMILPVYFSASRILSPNLPLRLSQAQVILRLQI